MPKDVVAAADPLDKPALLFKGGDTCLPLTAWGSRRVDGDAAAVDGRDREAVFVHYLEVGLNGLLGHLGGFLDRLALGGDTR